MPTKAAIHHGKRIHIKCRRCGHRAYHIRKKRCAACGFGETKKLKKPAHRAKNLQRTRRIK